MESEKIIIEVDANGSKSLEELDKLLKDSSTSASQLNKVLDDMSKSLASTNSKMKELTVGTKEYNKAMSDATRATEALSIARSKVSSALDIKVPNKESIMAPFAAVQGTILGIEHAADKVTKSLIGIDNAAQVAVNSLSKGGSSSTLSSIDNDANKATKSIVTLNEASKTAVGYLNSGVSSSTFEAVQVGATGARSSILGIGNSAKEASENIQDANISYNNTGYLLEDISTNSKIAENSLGSLSSVGKVKASELEAAYDNVAESVNRVRVGDSPIKNVKVKVDRTELIEAKKEVMSLSDAMMNMHLLTAKISKAKEQAKPIVADTTTPTATSTDIPDSKPINNIAKGADLASNRVKNLQMSMQQVARELPSLAMGPQMFILAISNNLPMLLDQVKALQAANVELAKSGQGTVSVGRSLLGSLVSWQTAVVVGITLIVAYGKDMLEWAETMIKGKDAINEFTLASKALNDVTKQSRADTQKEITNLKLLYGATTNAKRSVEERTIAVKELKKQYPTYFKGMSDEAIMAGNASKAYQTLSRDIIASAKAKLISSKMSQLATKQMEKDMEAAGKLMQIKQDEIKYQKDLESYYKLIESGQEAPGTLEYLSDRYRRIEKLKEEYKGLYNDGLAALKAMQLLEKEVNIKDLTSTPKDTKIPKATSESVDTTPYVKKYTGPTKAELEQFEPLEMVREKEIDSLDNFENERLAVTDKYRTEAQQGFFIDKQSLIDRDLAVEEARRKDIERTKAYYQEKLKLAEKDKEAIPAKEEAFKANEELRSKEIESLNKYLTEEARLKDEQLKLEDKYEIDKKAINAKYKGDDAKKRIATITKTYEGEAYKIKVEVDTNKASIETAKSNLESLKKTSDGLNEGLRNLNDSANKIPEITKAIKDGDVAMSQSRAETAKLASESTANKLDMAGVALDSMSQATDGIVNLYKQQQAAADDRYNAEADRIKESNMNEDEKTKALAANEKARYEEKKKIFEKQKKWEEATAWMNFASGVVGIWKGSTTLGPIAGPIVAGVQTAALLATTVANVKTIRAQKIDAPSAGSKGSGASSPSLMQLTPIDTALKSKDEDIETIRNGSNRNQSVQIVKVSDINKVQSTVSVRDNNSKF